jgi:hypothetical protein
MGSLVLQLAMPGIASAANMPRALALYVWLMIMLVLVLVALLNHREAGLLLVSLGIGLNALVIAINGGMPVSEQAVTSLVGHTYVMSSDSADILHVPIRPSTVAASLSDTIPLPGPKWHRGVVSVGDVFIASGVAAFVFISMTRGASRSDGD